VLAGWRTASAFTSTNRSAAQVHSEPAAHLLSGQSHRAGDEEPWLSAPDSRASAWRNPAAAPLYLCFSRHRGGNNTSCLLADGNLFENVWEGSERSCNCVNPKCELKIQKLLLCLLFAASDEAQLPTATRAQVPPPAPKLLFSCGWSGIYPNLIAHMTLAVTNKARTDYSRRSTVFMSNALPLQCFPDLGFGLVDKYLQSLVLSTLIAC